MHELSIAMSVLDIAAEESERRDGVPITAIHIKLGPLAGVIKPALISAFDLAREATAQAHCELVVEEVPIIAYCSTCQMNQPINSPQWLCCPECGTPAVDIRQGRELEVTAMEIET